MLLIMLMTNKPAIMRDQVNSAAMNVLGGSQQVPSCSQGWPDNHLDLPKFGIGR